MCCVCACVDSLSLSPLAYKFVLVWTAACDRVKHHVRGVAKLYDLRLLFVVVVLACLPVLGVALMYNQQLI